MRTDFMGSGLIVFETIELRQSLYRSDVFVEL